MSACWVSKPLTLSLLAVLALGALAPAPAEARRVSRTTIKNDDGTVTNRVEINGRTVSVTTSRTDSTETGDSAGVTIGGDFEGGPIVVHGNGNGVVRLFSDARVGPGERVDGDVVAVFGSVRVEGEVTGSAVAVFGSLDLRRGAVVHGDAVAVGGGLHEGEGARVSGQTVQVGFLPLTLGLPGLPVVLATIVLCWLVSLFFGWIAAALFPGRLARIAVTSSRRTAASLGLGIVSGPLMLMSMALLMVTVIGIPLAVFLPLAYIAVVYAGQIAATYVLGCKLTRRRLGAGGVTAPLIAGSLLVASIFGFGAILWDTPGIIRTVALFFMLVGLLLIVGLSTIGTGAFILSRAGSRPHDIGDGAAPGGAAPVPPAPAAEAPAVS
jgi:hypothetical protein